METTVRNALVEAITEELLDWYRAGKEGDTPGALHPGRTISQMARYYAQELVRNAATAARDL